MVVIVGCIVVLACVLGGFTLSGGHIGALIHPAEVLTIAGAAIGAMIVMAPVKVLKDLMNGISAIAEGLAVQQKGLQRTVPSRCTSSSDWPAAKDCSPSSRI